MVPLWTPCVLTEPTKPWAKKGPLNRAGETTEVRMGVGSCAVRVGSPFYFTR